MENVNENSNENLNNDLSKNVKGKVNVQSFKEYITKHSSTIAIVLSIISILFSSFALARSNKAPHRDFRAARPYDVTSNMPNNYFNDGNFGRPNNKQFYGQKPNKNGNNGFSNRQNGKQQNNFNKKPNNNQNGGNNSNKDSKSNNPKQDPRGNRNVAPNNNSNPTPPNTSNNGPTTAPEISPNR